MPVPKKHALAAYAPALLSATLIVVAACGQMEEQPRSEKSISQGDSINDKESEDDAFLLEVDGGGGSGGGSLPTVKKLRTSSFRYKAVNYYYYNYSGLYGSPSDGYVSGPAACPSTGPGAGPVNPTVPDVYFPTAGGTEQILSDGSVRQCGWSVRLSANGESQQAANAQEARQVLPTNLSAVTYQCAEPRSTWLFDYWWVISTTWELEEAPPVEENAAPGTAICIGQGPQPTPTPEPTLTPTPTPTPGPCPEEFANKKLPKDHIPSTKLIDFMSGFEGGLREDLYSDKTPAKYQADPEKYPTRQKGNCTVGIGHLIHNHVCLTKAEYETYKSGVYATEEQRASIAPRGDKEKPFRDMQEQVANGQMTQEQYKERLRQQKVEDLEQARRKVRAYLPNVEMTQNEYDAMIDLAYNTSEKGFKNSEPVKHMLEGDRASASQEISRWKTDEAKRQGLGGLVTRRSANGRMLSGDCEGYNSKP